MSRGPLKKEKWSGGERSFDNLLLLPCHNFLPFLHRRLFHAAGASPIHNLPFSRNGRPPSCLLYPPPTFSSGRKSKEKGERLVKTCSPLQKSPSLLSLVSGRRSPLSSLPIDRWRLLSTLGGGRRERAFLPSLSLSTRTRPLIRPRVVVESHTQSQGEGRNVTQKAGMAWRGGGKKRRGSRLRPRENYCLDGGGGRRRGQGQRGTRISYPRKSCLERQVSLVCARTTV